MYVYFLLSFAHIPLCLQLSSSFSRCSALQLVRLLFVPFHQISIHELVGNFLFEIQNLEFYMLELKTVHCVKMGLPPQL
mgnify:CR=1 FL=1